MAISNSEIFLKDYRDFYLFILNDFNMHIGAHGEKIRNSLVHLFYNEELFKNFIKDIINIDIKILDLYKKIINNMIFINVLSDTNTDNFADNLINNDDQYKFIFLNIGVDDKNRHATAFFIQKLNSKSYYIYFINSGFSSEYHNHKVTNTILVQGILRYKINNKELKIFTELLRKICLHSDLYNIIILFLQTKTLLIDNTNESIELKSELSIDDTFIETQMIGNCVYRTFFLLEVILLNILENIELNITNDFILLKRLYLINYFFTEIKKDIEGNTINNGENTFFNCYVSTYYEYSKEIFYDLINKHLNINEKINIILKEIKELIDFIDDKANKYINKVIKINTSHEYNIKYKKDEDFIEQYDELINKINYYKKNITLIEFPNNNILYLDAVDSYSILKNLLYNIEDYFNLNHLSFNVNEISSFVDIFNDIKNIISSVSKYIIYDLIRLLILNTYLLKIKNIYNIDYKDDYSNINIFNNLFYEKIITNQFMYDDTSEVIKYIINKQTLLISDNLVIIDDIYNKLYEKKEDDVADKYSYDKVMENIKEFTFIFFNDDVDYLQHNFFNFILNEILTKDIYSCNSDDPCISFGEIIYNKETGKGINKKNNCKYCRQNNCKIIKLYKKSYIEIIYKIFSKKNFKNIINTLIDARKDDDRVVKDFDISIFLKKNCIYYYEHGFFKDDKLLYELYYLNKEKFFVKPNRNYIPFKYNNNILNYNNYELLSSYKNYKKNENVINICIEKKKKRNKSSFK